jgi:hypothetical protein
MSIARENYPHRAPGGTLKKTCGHEAILSGGDTTPMLVQSMVNFFWEMPNLP